MGLGRTHACHVIHAADILGIPTWERIGHIYRPGRRLKADNDDDAYEWVLVD